MSELQPRTAKVGDWYRTALGLRLLPVGSVIRNGPRTHPIYFCKVDVDAWAYSDSAGTLRTITAYGGVGSSRMPFRSEQIWLPGLLAKIGAGASMPLTEGAINDSGALVALAVRADRRRRSGARILEARPPRRSRR